jgi:Na+/melibiose symporter-like transporter
MFGPFLSSVGDHPESKREDPDPTSSEMLKGVVFLLSLCGYDTFLSYVMLSYGALMADFTNSTEMRAKFIFIFILFSSLFSSLFGIFSSQNLLFSESSLLGIFSSSKLKEKKQVQYVSFCWRYDWLTVCILRPLVLV